MHRTGHTLRLLWRRLRGVRSPGVLAASIALGLFVGCLPLYGLHLPICLLACIPLRLDFVAAYLAANISNPVLAPVLLFGEIQLGAWLLTGEILPLELAAVKQSGISGFILQAALGSLIVGSACALIGGTATWFFCKRRRFEAEDPLEVGLARTIRRYRSAAAPDRAYVALKLYFDPALEQIAALEGSFGRVVDAGAGRGQLALALLDLGRADTVYGFDWDDRKVHVARSAAPSQAEFEHHDLRSASWRPADTLLMIDVLHYLCAEAQDAVLAQAAACVAPGGRLIVRELDPRRGLRSWVTRLAERIGTKLGYNHGSTLEFRPVREILERLEQLGLRCETPGPTGTLSNVLLVAHKPS